MDCEPLLGEMVTEKVFELVTKREFWKFGIVTERILNYSLTEMGYIVKWFDTKQEQWYSATDIFKMKCDVPLAKKEYL